jgi:hypothetical protein
MKSTIHQTSKSKYSNDGFTIDYSEFNPNYSNPNELTPSDPKAATFIRHFPYAYQWIYSEESDRTGKQQWYTETRYPIDGRHLWARHQEQNNKFVGVRFAPETKYCLLDIDRDSPNHPRQSESKFKGILHSLEAIGLNRPLLIQSSHNEGIHIYYPLSESVSSFSLACGLKSCLKNDAYEIASGVLESFPNTKHFGTPDRPTEFNGHRLPLQAGSYILNDDLERVGNDIATFNFIWSMCADSQDMDILKEQIAIAKSNFKPPKLSKAHQDAIAWQNSLLQKIEQGWTEQGQSNKLLYTIGKYARIFANCRDEESIAAWIVQKCYDTMGFLKYCRDVKRIKQKAMSIARWCMKFHYAFGTKKLEKKKEVAQRRADRQAERLERITKAVKNIDEQGTANQTISGLANAIAKLANVSIQTLYDVKHLWHPEFYKETCNTAQDNDSSQFSLDLDVSTDSTQTQATSTITETSLYEACVISEAPAQPENLQKFAKSAFEAVPSAVDLAECDRKNPIGPQAKPKTAPEFSPLVELPAVKAPELSKMPMWIETVGRKALEKLHPVSKPKAQNSNYLVTNAECFKMYEPEKVEKPNSIEIRIGFLKTLLNTPVLSRSKTKEKLAEYRDELEMLEQELIEINDF